MELDRRDKRIMEEEKQEHSYTEQFELMTVYMTNQALVMFMMGVVIAKLDFFVESQQNYQLRQKILKFLPFLENRTLPRNQFIATVLSQIDKFKNHQQIQIIQPLQEQLQNHHQNLLKLSSISQEQAIKKILNRWRQFNQTFSNYKFDIDGKNIEQNFPNQQKVPLQNEYKQTFIECPLCKIKLKKVSADGWVQCKCDNKICIDCKLTEKSRKIQCICPRQKKQKSIKPASKLKAIKKRKRII